MKVNILGTEYNIIYSTPKKYPVLIGSDGVTDTTTKEIIVNELKREQKRSTALFRKRNFI